MSTFSTVTLMATLVLATVLGLVREQGGEALRASTDYSPIYASQLIAGLPGFDISRARSLGDSFDPQPYDPPGGTGGAGSR